MFLKISYGPYYLALWQRYLRFLWQDRPLWMQHLDRSDLITYKSLVHRAHMAHMGGHGYEFNGHRCPCLRHGHGLGRDTKFLGKHGVDMDIVAWERSFLKNVA